MQIPKKITPDSIIKAVIEIRYNSHVPFEVLLGILVSSFPNNYKYTNRQINNPLVGVENSFVTSEIVVNLNNRILLYNENISVEFRPNSLIFTCLGRYIGSEIFIPEIERALLHMCKTRGIQQFTRVGLRYVTEYPNQDIRKSIKFDFTFGLPEIESLTTSFRSEFPYGQCMVILNLTNNVPNLKQHKSGSEDVTHTSVIDIDVIKGGLKILATEVSSLIEHIKEVHRAEKTLFFSMLRPEFLETLKPEY